MLFRVCLLNCVFLFQSVGFYRLRKQGCFSCSLLQGLWMAVSLLTAGGSCGSLSGWTGCSPLLPHFWGSHPPRAQSPTSTWFLQLTIVHWLIGSKWSETSLWDPEEICQHVMWNSRKKTEKEKKPVKEMFWVVDSIWKTDPLQFQ